MSEPCTTCNQGNGITPALMTARHRVADHCRRTGEEKRVIVRQAVNGALTHMAEGDPRIGEKFVPVEIFIP